MDAYSFAHVIIAASIVFFVFLVVAAIGLYVSSHLRLRKQKAYFEQLHSELASGQRVVFSGGLYGTLKHVGTETCDIEIKSGQVIEVSRFAIEQIIKKD